MKRKTKNILSIILLILILLSIIITSYFKINIDISNELNIYNILLCLESITLSIVIIYIIITRFNKIKIKQLYKNKDKMVVLVLGVPLLSILLSNIIMYSTNITDKIIITNKSMYSHGSNIIVDESDLYTISSVTNYKVSSFLNKDAKDGEYTKLFNQDKIEDVKITIDENNWNYLLQNAIDKPTVLANKVSIGDYEIRYVGLKTKGNLTLKEVWNSTSDKFSFTINFGKYINKDNGYSEKQNLLGLSKISLNNIYGDPTLMKEYLSYELMKEMKIPTPEYSLVNLYVNDEPYGIYMLVEAIDSSLIERTLEEETTFITKPEGSGSDLVYSSSLDKYYKDETFDFSDILYDKDGNIIYPQDNTNPLYKYSGLWENDESKFENTVDMLPTIFKWMKTLNTLSNSDNPNSNEYKKELESIINVDEVIRYFATNTYLVNLDSYQSEKMQNYALHINEDGKASIIPWDYNFSFGGYGIRDASSIVNFNIYKPLFNTILSNRPLLKVILQNDDYKKLYQKYLKDCTIITTTGGKTSDNKIYQNNNFSSILNKYHEILYKIYSSKTTDFYTKEEYNNATEELIKLINDRTKSVLNQLDGNSTKIETEVNISYLGGQERVNNNRKNNDKENKN